VPEEYYDDLDSLTGLSPGTSRGILAGCDEDTESIAIKVKVVLGVLILIWALWRKVKLSRIYRFVLRRFLLFAGLFFLLDKIEDMVLKLIPAIDIIAGVLDELGGICDGEQQTDNPKGAASPVSKKAAN
jgi:hypothetical protein